MNTQERFWSKVDRSGECWIWTACKSSAGYGNFTLNDRSVVAHRLAWTWTNGPIPAGLEIDHLCRNRACVNPDHLEPVTKRENILRGTGAAARNARATHCPQGHAYDEANTHLNPRGYRYCRACESARTNRRRLNRQQERAHTS